MTKVLLFSGGFDSILQEAFIEPDILLYVDMKSPYSKEEIKNLKKLPRHYLDKLHITEAYPLAKNYSDKTHYVPFRNLFLLTIAFQYGEDVYMGFNASDNAPDKDVEFVQQVNTLFGHMAKDEYIPTSWEENTPKVHIPFKQYTKTEMVKLYVEQFPDRIGFIQKIRSCYSGVSALGCGKCAPCVAKAVALINNNMYKKGLFDNEVNKNTIRKFIEINRTYRPDNPVNVDYENALSRFPLR